MNDVLMKLYLEALERIIESNTTTDFDIQFYKFLLRHEIYPQKNGWSKEFHPIVKNQFVRDNAKSTVPKVENPNFPYKYPFYKNENARGYYISVMDGWKLGSEEFERCRYCNNKLAKEYRSSKQKFCCTNHRVYYYELKKEAKRLGGIIMWMHKKSMNPYASYDAKTTKQKENPEFLDPKKKDMFVHLPNMEKYQLTKKGRTLKPK
jgi:hypothetical protein